MREFRSVQVWLLSRNVVNAHVRGAVRALDWCFKRKRTWRSWHHVRGHYEKSLCSDNDPRCYLREIKIISSDWIALLRRLLIESKAPPRASLGAHHLISRGAWKFFEKTKQKNKTSPAVEAKIKKKKTSLTWGVKKTSLPEKKKSTQPRNPVAKW